MYKRLRCVVVQTSKPGLFDILIAMRIFFAMNMCMLICPLAKDERHTWVGCTWQREILSERLHDLLARRIHIPLVVESRLGTKALQCYSTCEDVVANFEWSRKIRPVEQFEIACRKTWTCRMMKV
jgi:hypothetical protein